MGHVSRDARLTFILLWTLADDSGRLRGNSRMLASLLFPYDEDAGRLMDGWLGELERECCIARYVVEGSTFIEVRKWLSHQKIDKPSASRLPPFTESSRGFAKAREGSSEDLDLDLGMDQGREGTSPPALVVDEVLPGPSAAGLLCRAIKAAGVADVNPGHPDLLRLIAGGIPSETFTAAAADLSAKGRGRFLLLLKTVEGQWNDAQAAGPVAAAVVADPWETRAGVDSIAKQLGIHPWDECCEFRVFKARVRAEFDRKNGVKAA